MILFLLRCALAVAPARFRHRFEDEIERDIATAPVAAEIVNMLGTGMSLRVEGAFRDLSSCISSLISTPLLTLVSVIAVTIGLGANLTSATLVNQLLFHRLPFPEPQELLFAQENKGGVSYPVAMALGSAIQKYADLAVAESDSRTLQTTGSLSSLRGAVVSENYFRLLKVKPEIGAFVQQGTASFQNIIISYNLWKKKFDGRPILGTTVELDRHAYRIAAVAPQRFRGLPEFDVDTSYWLLVNKLDQNETAPENQSFSAIIRLHHGVDVNVAERSIQQALARILHNSQKGHSGPSCCATVVSASSTFTNEIRPLLWLLYAATAIILVIASLNVAGLQITRNLSRATILATRATLGASPTRLTYELCLEIGIVAMVGCTLGLGFSQAVIIVASRIVPQLDGAGITAPIAIYSLALALITTFLMAFFPCLVQRTSNILAAMKGAGRGSLGSGNRRVLAALIIVEVALAAMLVISSSLVVRSFVALTNAPLGFLTKDVFVAELQQSTSEGANMTSEEDPRTRQFGSSVVKSIAAVPGVQVVSTSSQLPFACCNLQRFSIPGGPQRVMVLFSVISPGYFNAMHIPMILVVILIAVMSRVPKALPLLIRRLRFATMVRLASLDERLYRAIAIRSLVYQIPYGKITIRIRSR